MLLLFRAMSCCFAGVKAVKKLTHVKCIYGQEVFESKEVRLCSLRCHALYKSI